MKEKIIDEVASHRRHYAWNREDAQKIFEWMKK